MSCDKCDDETDHMGERPTAYYRIGNSKIGWGAIAIIGCEPHIKEAMGRLNDRTPDASREAEQMMWMADAYDEACKIAWSVADGLPHDKLIGALQAKASELRGRAMALRTLSGLPAPAQKPEPIEDEDDLDRAIMKREDEVAREKDRPKPRGSAQKPEPCRCEGCNRIPSECPKWIKTPNGQGGFYIACCPDCKCPEPKPEGGAR